MVDPVEGQVCTTAHASNHDHKSIISLTPELAGLLKKKKEKEKHLETSSVPIIAKE